MTRLLGPDEAYRLVYLIDGTARAQGATGRLFADSAGLTPADLLTEGGSPIAVVSGAAQVDIDSYSRWPRVQYPDGADTIYGSVNGGPITPLLADIDGRIDAAVSSIATNATAITNLRTGITALGPIKQALTSATRSAAIQVLGDSTGNDGNEWVAQLSSLLATAYPAWTVHRRLWDDTTQAYGAPTVVSTGTAGARYMDCSTGSSTRQMPLAVSPNITGQIDARIKLTMADWTPSAQANVMGRTGGSGSRGWYVAINSSGLLVFVYSVDGTALVSVFGSSPGFADGSTNWIRVVFTPDDGAGNKTTAFYKSTDGITWTQVGSTVTTAGTVTLHDAGVGFEIGGTVGGIGNTGMFVHEVAIHATTGTPSLVPALPDLWPSFGTGAAQVVGAPILTFVNGSQPGAGISYLGDSTRLPKMTPDFGQLVTFLSDSHNESNSVGRSWIASYDTWRAAVLARLQAAPTITILQNPESSGSTWYREHNLRQLDLRGYAATHGLGLVNVYDAFLANTTWATDWMVDSIHPNTAGSTVWAQLVKTAFDAIS